MARANSKRPVGMRLPPRRPPGDLERDRRLVERHDNVSGNVMKCQCPASVTAFRSSSSVRAPMAMPRPSRRAGRPWETGETVLCRVCPYGPAPMGGRVNQGCSQGKPKTRHELILASVLAGGRGVGGDMEAVNV